MYSDLPFCARHSMKPKFGYGSAPSALLPAAFGSRLIQVDQRRQVRAARVDEVRRQHHAVGQLALHAGARLLRRRLRRVLARPRAGAAACSSPGRRIEVRRVQEARREALRAGRRPARRGVCGDRLVDQPRHVQRQLIFAADAIEQVVEDAPAAAQHRRCRRACRRRRRAARSCCDPGLTRPRSSSEPSLAKTRLPGRRPG